MSWILCDRRGLTRSADCQSAHSAEHFVVVDDHGRAVTVFDSWYGAIPYPTDDEIREAFESTPAAKVKQ